ncbi:phenylacetate-CoA oxygenase subunit PaaI [Klebsiella pneumoniae subsp. pneumoniae]|nr:phenylacetate-CoA oxygenase subunit PaaI [Klebsiella pneumoniae subsp. pneumoniae]
MAKRGTHGAARLRPQIPQEAAFRSGGKQGLHSEHLGPLLAEMQYLQRSHPGLQW